MTFPVVAGSATSSEAANTTAHDVTLPASIAAGDLILAWVFKDGASTFTWPGSWVEMVDGSLGLGGSCTVGYLIASGGETTVQVTSSASERSNHVSARITGWHGTTPPASSATATGLSTQADPDSLNPADWDVEDTLWIAWCGHDVTGTETGDQTFSVYPLASNNIASPIAASAAVGAICSTNSAVASLDPGTFTYGLSRSWRAGTIAVRPAAGAAVFLPRRSPYPQLLAH